MLVEAMVAELLVALAGGTAGAAGAQAWTALRELVRRGPGPDTERAGAVPLPPGVAEADALERSVGREERAVVDARALLAALELRAGQDAAFRAGLEAWWRSEGRAAEDERARRTGEGDVHNTIEGGTQHNVVMGRDFHGPMNFH
ncbi:hypothetical protein ACIGHB_19125 [Streptomyces sp. NPDC085460]|uniref:hypothetical protein n=1 Tax=Streptomyces sp. NPDC085460 TaxID=3365723 RepID=UPI0037CDA3D3